jgi:hypothetical protein
MSKLLKRVVISACLLAAVSCSLINQNGAARAIERPSKSFEQAFTAPASTSKPWVYWYFMDGHITREGLLADLESMKEAGIGGALFLTVDIGVPRGPVAFMSAEWQELFAYAVKEADRLGIEITLGVGPGWAGTGGPWVAADDAMQHLVGSATQVKGGGAIEIELPKPQPREPYFGRGPFTPELLKTWQEYYRDVVVLAYPTPSEGAKVVLLDEKALYYRAPYTSAPNVRPFLDSPANPRSVPAEQCLDRSRVIDLTANLGADGRLQWKAPEGEWTVYRFGRTLTGQTSRPAPLAGLGFETDKLSTAAIDAHIKSFIEPLLDSVGKPSAPHRGLTLLHLDSWEMGSQNWSPTFRDEFERRRGYDPLPYLPAYLGQYVGDAGTTERFLWDVRQTARELLYENHALFLRDYAHRRGLGFSAQSYDMTPSGDLRLGSVGDVPMGEFWSWGLGFSSEFSVVEAVSIAHTNGKPIVGGEAFTAEREERWQQYPARMKAQTDWALAGGLNRFVIHRYQHQPRLDEFPGMRMGEYGVHWERTQTFWPMVNAYHDYLTRCSDVLRVGLPVADILFLAPEGAPHVFRAPRSATWGDRLDRRGYNFDGCDPDTLIERASVEEGKIRFPDGMTYRVLVLPRYDTMTPRLLRKVKQLLEAGATVIGPTPRKSPSLSGFPKADAEVATLAREMWGATPVAERRVGKGRLINDLYSPEQVEFSELLAGAKWIWNDDGTPGADAPPQTRYFKRQFAIDSTEAITAATLWLSVDNVGEIYVNDQKVGGGIDFTKTPQVDARAALKPGQNVIRVVATNEGERPNPAGVFGYLSIAFADGSTQSIVTDADWTSSETPEGAPAKVKVIDDLPGGWQSARPSNEYRDLYPDYDTTARVLQSKRVAPDFQSDVQLRYTHRTDGDVDLYFIANPSDQAIETTATFRIEGRTPERWNPLTGERRVLSNGERGDGVTKLPLRLGPTESCFIVFRKQSLGAAAVMPSPTGEASTDVKGPWTVKFDPRWGGPAETRMESLSDWSTNSDPAVRFYSGQATYLTTFDVSPSTLSEPAKRLALSLGEVRIIARVKLNGQDLGVVWCPPWRVELPEKILRAKGNRLEITVANQWINRLIGDAALPAEKRFTKTSTNSFKVGDALQASGLIGPVRLQIIPE